MSKTIAPLVGGGMDGVNPFAAAVTQRACVGAKEEFIQAFRRGLVMTLCYSQSAENLQKIARNNPEQVLKAAAEAYQDRLIPGSECHLVPYQDTVSYQRGISGIRKLIRSEGVTIIREGLVWEGDIFIDEVSVEGGIDRSTFKHIGKTVGEYPAADWDSKLVGGYCMWRDKGDDMCRHYFVAAGRIVKSREVSKSWKAFKAGKISRLPWKDWPIEMVQKTVITASAKVMSIGHQMRERLLDDSDYPDFNAKQPAPVPPVGQKYAGQITAAPPAITAVEAEPAIPAVAVAVDAESKAPQEVSSRRGRPRKAVVAKAVDEDEGPPPSFEPDPEPAPAPAPKAKKTRAKAKAAPAPAPEPDPDPDDLDDIQPLEGGRPVDDGPPPGFDEDPFDKM